jgi:BirA family biotin operon repressor/biotin-[acetyl-CoA-carboxylase] ligase
MRQALGAPSLADEVVTRWSVVSATLGRRVAAVGLGGVAVEGLAIAVDETGRLVVETVDGPIAVACDEVEHLR